MTARHFGLTQRAGGPNLAGGNVQHSARLPIAANTHRNSNSIPPLPAQSLADDSDILDCDRENAATVFVIGFFALIIIALYAAIKLSE